MLIVFTTVSNVADAEALATKIVEAKLAACIQILPQIRSVYYWEGKLRNEAEHLLLIKTLDEKYLELESFVRENHSYDVPEIVAIPAEKVSDDYLAWVRNVMNEK